MPPSRKRRLDLLEEANDSSDASSRPTRRRRRSSSPSNSASPAPSDAADQAAFSIPPLSKKLIRLALSLSHARIPLRRADISNKVLPPSSGSGRQLPAIFAATQAQLQALFGMQLVELPEREKTSLKERRAQTTKLKVGAGSSSKSWVLVSTLSKAYRTNAAIVRPARVGAGGHADTSYTAFYTMVVSLVYLAGGTLAEAKLERYLKRAGIEQFTPMGTTEKVLQRMVKEGYIEKRRDAGGDGEMEWVVGPRGKVEIGVAGVKGLVKRMYGVGGEEEDGEEYGVAEEELESKLNRSLGIRVPVRQGGDDEEEQEEQQEVSQPQAEPPRKGKGRLRKAAAAEDEAEDEDDD